MHSEVKLWLSEAALLVGWGVMGWFLAGGRPPHVLWWAVMVVAIFVGLISRGDDR